MRRLIGSILGALAGMALAGGANAASPGTAGDPAMGAPDAPLRPALVIALTEVEPAEITGRLPEGIGRSDLRAVFPGATFDAAMVTGVPGDAERWQQALTALPVALPRIARARIELCDRRIRIEGRLKPGFSLRAAGPALRAALGPDWDLDLTLEEAPPEPAIDFTASAEAIRVAGMLPDGLSVRQGIATFEETLGTAGGSGTERALQIATGASGDTAAWSAALAVTGRLLRLYDTAEGRIEPGRFAIDGQLAPGQTRAEIGDWLTASLPEGWEIAVAGKEQPTADSAERVSPRTGGTERNRGGHWIAVLPVEADIAICQRTMQRAQQGSVLTFLSGQSVLSDGTGPLLDHLAAVTLACLAGGPARRLEIGGHTDALGDDARNLALSEARAEAIRLALGARGVPETALAAIGHGASQPVAPNDTEDGRRRNRRITFDWSED